MWLVKVALLGLVGPTGLMMAPAPNMDTLEPAPTEQACKEQAVDLIRREARERGFEVMATVLCERRDGA